MGAHDDQVEAADRVRREAEFHDSRFSTDERPAGRFYAITGSSADHYRRLVDGIPASAEVLELGCGLQSAMWDMLARGVEVTAIDISQVAIDAAQERSRELGLQKGRFLVMNGEALEFADATFDAVTGTGILHHLDIERGLSECARVLRPEGRLIMMEPLGHNPAVNMYRRFTPDQRTEDEHPLLMSDFDTLRRHFRDVRIGFYHFLSLGSLAFSRLRSFDRVLNSLEGADQWVFRRVPATRRMAWMTVIEASHPR